MAEEQQRKSVGIVSDGPAGQRFAERLTRAGLLAYAITPDALVEQAQGGQLYLAPLGVNALVEAIVQRGVHACLLPPWPVGAVMLGGSMVRAAEIDQRGAVLTTTALMASATHDATHDAKPQPLKILYRERLIGALSVALAETETGEQLLGALPRTSNRHGCLLVTTLQLGVSSAQTRLDDVTWLIERVLAWLADHAEMTSLTAAPNQQDEADQRKLADDYAPIVALALALMLPELQPDEHPSRVDDIQLAARQSFAQVCQALGLAADRAQFEAGWEWLVAHGVAQAGDPARVDAQELQRVSAMWQLSPRLRRLRHTLRS